MAGKQTEVLKILSFRWLTGLFVLTGLLVNAGSAVDAEQSEPSPEIVEEGEAQLKELSEKGPVFTDYYENGERKGFYMRSESQREEALSRVQPVLKQVRSKADQAVEEHPSSATAWLFRTKAYLQLVPDSKIASESIHQLLELDKKAGIEVMRFVVSEAAIPNVRLVADACLAGGKFPSFTDLSPKFRRMVRERLRAAAGSLPPEGAFFPRYLLGRLLLQQGKHQSAVTELKKSVQESQWGTSSEWLKYSLQKQGRFADARALEERSPEKAGNDQFSEFLLDIKAGARVTSRALFTNVYQQECTMAQGGPGPAFRTPKPKQHLAAFMSHGKYRRAISYTSDFVNDQFRRWKCQKKHEEVGPECAQKGLAAFGADHQKLCPKDYYETLQIRANAFEHLGEDDKVQQARKRAEQLKQSSVYQEMVPEQLGCGYWGKPDRDEK